MATPLGTLTLNLVAQVGTYIDRINQAERTTSSNFAKMRSAANKWGTAAAASSASVAVALGAMTAAHVESIAELERFAFRAQATTQDFQKMAVGAKAYGIEAETLSGMMKDFNEKLGELTAVGAGGGIDFFEQIAMKTEGSAQGAKKLILEMQKLSGPQALQLYVKKLEEAGVTQRQMSFYLETMASDITDLIPLLQNGGEGMNIYARAAEKAGLVMSDSTIKQTKILKEQIYLLDLQLQGAKNQLMQEVVPAFVDIANAFELGDQKAEGMTTSGEALANMLRGVAAIAAGVYSTLNLVANSIAGVAASAVSAYQNVDAAAENSAWYNKIPGVKLFKATAQVALDVQSTDGIIADMADKNAKIAENSAKTIGAIFENQASTTAQTLANIRANAIGANSGLEDLAKKKDDEAAEAAKKSLDSAKQKYAYSKLELDMLKRVQQLSSANNLDGIGSKHGLPQGILAALMTQESKGHRDAVSESGAIGYFQTTSDYRKDNKISVADSKNLPVIAEVVARNLSSAYKELGSWEAAIRSHNAGVSGSRKFGETGRVKGSDKRNKEVSNFAPAVDKWFYALTGGSSFRHDTIGNKQDGNSDGVKDELKDYQDYLAKMQQENEQYQKDRQSLMFEYYSADLQQEYLHKEQVAELNKLGLSELAGLEEARFREAKKLSDMQRDYENYEHKMSEQEKMRFSQQIREQDARANAALDDVQRQEKLKALMSLSSQETTQFELQQKRQLLEIKRTWMSAGEYAREYYAIVREEILSSAGLSPVERESRLKQVDYERQSQKTDIHRNYQSSLGVDFSAEDAYEKRNQATRDAYEWQLITQEEYQAKMLESDKNFLLAKLALGAGSMQQIIGGWSDTFKTLLGEQSVAYHAMFALEKSFAVAKAMMNAPLVYTQTFAALSAIPFVGPYIAKPMALANAALQVAQAASIGSISLSGQAHDGIDNIPNTGTWLLEKGERVVDGRTNADLKEHLKSARGQSGGSANIVINVPPGYTAQRSRQGDRDVIDIVERYLGQQIQNPNSNLIQGITKKTTATVRR